ncbi:MAG: hypothetical protein ACOX0Z_01765 [Candidatus Nanosyncoccaceae bacterium]|jgi:hypothetical protein
MQKKQRINLLRQISRNRFFYIGMLLSILFGVSFTIYTLLLVNANDAFVWSRYTHFGIAHFYRDKWHYFYAWPLFGITTTALHTILANQSLKRGKNRLAMVIIMAALVIIFLAFLVVSRITKLPR